jgi:peptidoglycan-N-acetylglucosamine deacetylase
MFIHKTNALMRLLYPQFTWRKPQKNSIYLTFDDGPIPEVTEFVLEQLNQYNAQATFFCIGDNIVKHPQIFTKIIKSNHSIGNHTFNHLNGWKTEDIIYFENVELFNAQHSKYNTQNNTPKYIDLKANEHDILKPKPLFRPPYGRIKRSQAKVLLPMYEIVMWDVLTGDYSKEISSEVCLKKTLQYTEGGSIVLFHDSIKASKNVMYALPRVLEYFAEREFVFESL